MTSSDSSQSSTPTPSSAGSSDSTPETTAAPTPTSAPVAKKIPHERTHHGHTFVDDYEWMREKDSPEVIAHLEAENAWTEAQTAELERARGDLHRDQDPHQGDRHVCADAARRLLVLHADEGGSRLRHPRPRPCDRRRRLDSAGDRRGSAPGEEVVFDSNQAARGTDFFSLGTFSLTEDGRYLLYGVDTAGDERYVLRIRDLSTGEDLPDRIENTFAGATIDPSGRFVFYTTVDEAWRPEKVWRHTVTSDGADDSSATDPTAAPEASGAEDVCIFHEPDERFFVGVGFSRSERYLFIVTGSKTTTGYWRSRGDDLEAAPQEIWPRVDGVEYSVEHAVVSGEDRFLITHNRDRADFDIVDVPAADPTGDATETADAVDEPAGTGADPTTTGRRVLADVSGPRIEEVDAFADFVVISYRRGGFARVGIVRLTGDPTVPYAPLVEPPFDRETGTLGFGPNPEFDQPTVRLTFTSMSTPAVVYQHDVATGTDTVLKRQPVLGSVDLGAYGESLVWASASDGTRIPVSLVYRTDLVDVDEEGLPTASAPLILYGYGSYEISVDPYFSVARLSPLDRGVVYAIAHVRGGGEMGRHWYDEGKTTAKVTTFTDFIAVARHLVEAGWTTPERSSPPVGPPAASSWARSSTWPPSSSPA